MSLLNKDLENPLQRNWSAESSL